MSSKSVMYIFESPADVQAGEAFQVALLAAFPQRVGADGTVTNRFGDTPVLAPRFAGSSGAPQPGRVRGAMNINHGKLARVEIDHDGETYVGVQTEPGLFTFPALSMAYRFTTDGADAATPGQLRCRPVVRAVRQSTGSGEQTTGKVKRPGAEQPPATNPSKVRRVTTV